jgi:hypothetical protein
VAVCGSRSRAANGLNSVGFIGALPGKECLLSEEFWRLDIPVEISCGVEAGIEESRVKVSLIDLI